MNIIELAREADLAEWHPCIQQYGFKFADPVRLERFATLVRTQALEEAADICDGVNNYSNPMTANDCADAIRALKEKK